MDAELTKPDIRSLSKELALPTANLPASPCLASRMAYGESITEQKLNQVEQAEDVLRELGFVEFRVRHHGNMARIEVHAPDIGKILSINAGDQINIKTGAASIVMKSNGDITVKGGKIRIYIILSQSK